MMQIWVDAYGFITYFLAMIGLMFIIAITLLKVRIEVMTQKSLVMQYNKRVQHFTDQTLDLLLQHSILWRMAMFLMEITLTPEQIASIRDNLAKEIINDYSIDLKGPKPDETTFLFAYGLLDKVKDFFEKLSSMCQVPIPTEGNEPANEETGETDSDKETWEN